jgi:hypothetical protein
VLEDGVVRAAVQVLALQDDAVAVKQERLERRGRDDARAAWCHPAALAGSAHACGSGDRPQLHARGARGAARSQRRGARGIARLRRPARALAAVRCNRATYESLHFTAHRTEAAQALPRCDEGGPAARGGGWG